jgi:2,5-dihydroxypyridine 5,6-dioxygenase
VPAFPAAGAVDGTLVLDRGGVNLTFKRYLQDPVRLLTVNDHAVAMEDHNLAAELMRGYLAAWGDRAACAVSHLGWSLNRRARWDAMTFYDKADFNGTELRAFAGNFFYSTGATWWRVGARWGTSICRCAAAPSRSMARWWSSKAFCDDAAGV